MRHINEECPSRCLYLSSPPRIDDRLSFVKLPVLASTGRASSVSRCKRQASSGPFRPLVRAIDAIILPLKTSIFPLICAGVVPAERPEAHVYLETGSAIFSRSISAAALAAPLPQVCCSFSLLLSGCRKGTSKPESKVRGTASFSAAVVGAVMRVVWRCDGPTAAAAAAAVGCCTVHAVRPCSAVRIPHLMWQHCGPA